MATTKHPLQLVQPWEEDPEEVEGRAEEVDKESKHGERVDDKEELGVWDDALRAGRGRRSQRGVGGCR